MDALVKVTITPKMMAEAFWNMNDTEQVVFLLYLSKEIARDHETNSLAYSQGELQWYHLGRLLLRDENKEARSMLMTMAAPLYLNVLRATGVDVGG